MFPVVFAFLSLLGLSSALMTVKSIPDLPKMEITDQYVKDHTDIDISGEISSTSIDSKIMTLKTLAAFKSEIFITINSPGGEVYAMWDFIEAMKYAKSHNVTITCVVNDLAASAAYVIFTQCDRRVAYRHSELMFHEPAFFIFMGRISSDTLNQMRPTLELDDKKIRECIKNIEFPEDIIEYFYINSISWKAGDYVDKYGSNYIELINGGL